jgi:hypothetical protein
VPLQELLQSALVISNPKSFPNTAWSFATLGHHDPSLFEAIAKAAQVRIHEFNPQEISNTAWSFATMKYEAPALLDAIASVVPYASSKISSHKSWPIRHGHSQH